MLRSLPHAIRLTMMSAAMTAAIAACDRAPPAQPTADTNGPAGPAPAASAPAAAPAYTPPTAEQLYALVSPIALFPDKLVALTLAGSTHPDQIDAARSFLQSNRNLNGAALVDAADAQPWDPSVKSLVAFPSVLDQLGSNQDWTGALGAAYANQPTDVMNAIQVMRDRARAHGQLQSSAQQTVQVDEAPPPETTTETTVTSIVPAPERTIVIEPAESDVVYVPQYDPDVVYGEPVYSTVYHERWYDRPATRGDVVTAGLVSFGAGILVSQLFSSHSHHDGPRDGGWNAWNTSWGRGPRGEDHGRPSVVYENHPYVVDRRTVINRTINNRTVNNTYVNNSVHEDNRHDNGNGNIHGNGDIRGNAAPGATPGAAPPQRPDFAHMQRPNFTPAMAHATAPNERPNLPPPQARGQAPGQPEHTNGMRPTDPRVANVHAVGARPQPFDNNRDAGHAPGQAFAPHQPQIPPQAAQQSAQHAPPTPQARPNPPRDEPHRNVVQNRTVPAAMQPHVEQPRPQQQIAHQRPEPQQHAAPQQRPEPQQRPQPAQHQQAPHPQPHENHPDPQHHGDHDKHGD